MKALPNHLREGFLASVKDPEILSIRNELGLVDSRVLELIERITTGESIELINQIVELSRSIQTEVKRTDPDMDHIAEDADELTTLLEGRVNDEKNWADIRDTVESRRKLTETERKLLEMKKAVVDSKQLHAIITILLQSIATHVLPLEGGRIAVDGVSHDVRKLLEMN